MSIRSPDHHSISEQQARHRIEERRQALCALLMTPLMTPAHECFAAVHRHADELRAWFSRETGWALHIDREHARLYKTPADRQDASRGLPQFSRRHYVLLCLTCAVLERADVQITLRVLGERLMALAADPGLAAEGFTFTLRPVHERRELVTVCRRLLELGILQRVAGDEEGYVRSGSDTAHQGDALYDIRKRVLAGMLAAMRGPSTWPADQAPSDFGARLDSLTREHHADSEEGRRTVLRHHLARRLLDDPVVYFDELDEALRAYFINQRGAMANRLGEATGLIAEQRAEGLALVDEAGELTDLALPSEGTESHVTLLVAGFLCDRFRAGTLDVPHDDIEDFLAASRDQYGRFWRKSAREPGSERELCQIALRHLSHLKLVRHSDTHARALPALTRFSLVDATPAAAHPAIPTNQDSLF
ncbi:MAG: TIGR02678 family protein [Lautropia sp.]|nr:TIGR02678 family protein [Lautropia sp.]